MQICFLIKRKKNIRKYTAQLVILGYDNFVENQTHLHRNGMTAISKINKKEKRKRKREKEKEKSDSLKDERAILTCNSRSLCITCLK